MYPMSRSLLMYGRQLFRICMVCCIRPVSSGKPWVFKWNSSHLSDHWSITSILRTPSIYCSLCDVWLSFIKPIYGVLAERCSCAFIIMKSRSACMGVRPCTVMSTMMVMLKERDSASGDRELHSQILYNSLCILHHIFPVEITNIS